jgi:hypothetical protein
MESSYAMLRDGVVSFTGGGGRQALARFRALGARSWSQERTHAPLLVIAGPIDNHDAHCLRWTRCPYPAAVVGQNLITNRPLCSRNVLVLPSRVLNDANNWLFGSVDVRAGEHGVLATGLGCTCFVLIMRRGAHAYVLPQAVIGRP